MLRSSHLATLQWPEDKDQAGEEECSPDGDATLRDTRPSSEGAGSTATGGSFQGKDSGRAGYGAVQCKCQCVPWRETQAGSTRVEPVEGKEQGSEVLTSASV